MANITGITVLQHYQVLDRILSNCVFSLIAANFGGSYGCALGFSITAAAEIVYWMFIKPFGLKKKKQCKACGTYHHYDKNSHHRITRLVQGSTALALVIFSQWRFYLVAYRYLNRPIPDENRNQITSNYTTYFMLNFWEYFQ